MDLYWHCSSARYFNKVLKRSGPYTSDKSKGLKTFKLYWKTHYFNTLVTAAVVSEVVR